MCVDVEVRIGAKKMFEICMNPILGDTSVFVIGFYVGRGKPGDIPSFLRKLVLEFCRLLPSNCDIVCPKDAVLLLHSCA